VTADRTLNPEQGAAATHGAGPALVLAGPGTGKTTTLVERYVHLTRSGVAPDDVFVSTFTRKAAQELRSRIRRKARIDPKGLPIGTFHSYCFHLSGRPEVIDLPRRYAIIRDCMPDWRGDRTSVIDAIDRFKDSLVSPRKAQDEARKAKKSDRGELKRVADAYACYQAQLGEQGLVDFGDLLWSSIKLLRDRLPEKERFQHLLIDEYQDVNPAQEALIASLLTGGGQLWVVGDDDQAIYGWRGSDVKYITAFSRTHPGSATYRLGRNYRSSGIIIDVAQSLISQNSKRLSKSLLPATGLQSRPLCVARCDDEEKEAQWITGAIRKLIASGVSPEEIAILLRTNFQTVEFERSLSKVGIKFVIRGAGSFWDLPVVRALLSALWRCDPSGGRPPRDGPAYLVPILDDAARRSAPKGFAKQVTTLVSAAISARPRSMPAEQQIQWDGGAKRLRDESVQFSDLRRFLGHCQASIRKASKPEDEDEAVVLSTIHQAKGLEWEAVFLAGCEANLLPHKLSEDFEEERRLAYVAVTRAKQFLTLTWAANRAGGQRVESPFVGELCAGAKEEQIDRRGYETRATPIRQRGRTKRSIRRGTDFTVNKKSLSRSVRVRHAKFGEGTATAVKEDRYVVQFDGGDKKTVLSSFLEILG
jgi:ATP-dependent DNA helicase UvrD/PcrA